MLQRRFSLLWLFQELFRQLPPWLVGSLASWAQPKIAGWCWVLRIADHLFDLCCRPGEHGGVPEVCARRAILLREQYRRASRCSGRTAAHQKPFEVAVYSQQQDHAEGTGERWIKNRTMLKLEQASTALVVPSATLQSTRTPDEHERMSS